MLDCLEFSRDHGLNWTYVPVMNAGGFDPAVTDVRVRPRGRFEGSDGTLNPSFELRLKMRIN